MKRFVVFLIFIATSGLAHAGYLGCYADRYSRDLNGASFRAMDMTVEKCIAYCRSRGFSYAGLQYGTYCFCGNSYGRYGVSRGCSTPCGGNPSQVCGGAWANSVYSVPSGFPLPVGRDEPWRRHWRIIRELDAPITNTSEHYGWKCPIVDMGDAMPPAGGVGCAFYLHPVSRSEPAVLRGYYRRVPPGGVLVLKVAGNRNGDWVMQVVINGSVRLTKVVDGSGWHTYRVPVGDLAGRGMTVDLLVKANGWYFEYAFIDSIKLVSGAGPFPARTASRTFWYPRYGGYRLDWCREWASNCGKPAADEFCRRKGFARAKVWKMDPDIGDRTPTRIITSGEICSSGSCDGFKYITCVGSVVPPKPFRMPPRPKGLPRPRGDFGNLFK